MATFFGEVMQSLTRSNFDAASSLRVSQLYTTFDNKQIVDKQPLIWDDQLISGTGGASTFNTNQASTTLSVSAATACVRARQSFIRVNYQPGRSNIWRMTGILGTPATGITRRLGTFDDKNGLFFESSPTALRAVVRTFTGGSAVDNAIAQSSWNVDRLDGSGGSTNPSGFTIDLSKVQIFGCFYLWQGSGSAFFYVVINGQFIIVHRYDAGNTLSVPYMSTPNLPLRYEIRNDGTGGAASITHICTAQMSEGGYIETGFPRSINRGASPLITLNNTDLYPLISMRLNSSYLGTHIQFISVSVNCTTNTPFNWGIYLNPTVVGTALSFSQLTNSAIEADNTALNATTITGGTLLQSGSLFQNNGAGTPIIFPESTFRLGSTIAGVADFIVLAIQRLPPGGTETFYGAMSWQETS